MTDRELFQKTVKSLPSLALPLAGTSLAVWLVWVLLMKGFSSVTYLETGDELVLLLILLAAALLTDFLHLGSARLCLDRGEGKPGAMPWTILPQWRWYKGWILWMGLFPILWQAGKRLGRVWLAYRLTDLEFARFNMGMSVWNVVLSIGSLVLFPLLHLSVRTAYLRAPGRGFWRAVGFGLKEGFRKWPRTIGPQVKFVVPVTLGVRFLTALFTKLILQVGGRTLFWGSFLAGGALSMVENIWTWTLYGHLAAQRYDPPGGTEEKKKEEPECFM